MQCPVCKNINLVMTERQGIEIDYCPQCRGVWLDRGELDKIIDRSSQTTFTGQDHSRDNRREREYDDHDRREYDNRYQEQRYKRKKRGLLGEIFDFD
ncbi:MAG TPA: zf-TFIIB domain-containing protein [Syntrophorhabdaceae bacterium]|nr:zf-TFIIB domain-containing protein [Syntrophorhabdaceae bacterium]